MEAWQNARRRTSVASTTTNDDDETSTSPLDPDTSHDDTSRGQSRFPQYVCGGDKSKWLWQLGLVFSVLVLATLSISSLGTLSGYSYSSTAGTTNPFYGSEEETDSQEQMLGIPLHPEDHVFRAPKTITYDWNITSGYRSADGVKKEVYLVNGQFPGPTIECRSGDRLVVHVTNNLSSGEGVSIHWHGLHMRNANSMDGAVGFTQCPVANGKTFTYEFEADENQAGTFWWHAHSQVQRGDGMYGGLVVHKPFSLGGDRKFQGYGKETLLLIGDWYHRSADEVLAWYMSTRGFGNEPVPDSLLVNGFGRFICSMAVPARPVECVDIQDEYVPAVFGSSFEADPIRLRVINVGSLAGFTLGLSSGTFTPLTVDGDFPIKGELSTSIGILYPGERVDLLLSPDTLAITNSPQLLINLDHENFKYPNPALRPNQSFPLSLGTHIQHSENLMHFDLAAATGTGSRELQVQLSESTPNWKTILLYTKTQKLAKLSNHPTGFINRTSWAPQSNPPLPLLSLPRKQWDENQLVPWVPLSEEHSMWVDIIVNNLDDGAHPFHLHGSDFYVLASYRSEHGWGSYSPFETTGSSSITPKLNLKNPLRKDTVSVPRRGYVILRFRADNPGIWMLHCHVLFHQASGMAMGLLIGESEEHEFVDLGAKLLCG